jgi:hypothetical protein
MESIGFVYNKKNYTCQSLGPGKWSCSQTTQPADILLTCEMDGIDKIVCTLPESTTDLICETSYQPFNCDLVNTGNSQTKSPQKLSIPIAYLENLPNNQENNIISTKKDLYSILAPIWIYIFFLVFLILLIASVYNFIEFSFSFVLALIFIVIVTFLIVTFF